MPEKSHPDKDAVILKYQQGQSDNMAADLAGISQTNTSNVNRIGKIDAEIDEIQKLLGMSLEIEIEKKVPLKVIRFDPPYTKDDAFYNYDDIFIKAKIDLESKGINISDLSYHDLQDEEVIAAIDLELNRNLPRKEKWTKSDMIIVFVAASVGTLADLVFGNRTNSLTGSGYKAEISESGWNFSKNGSSSFSNWLNDNFHNHPTNNPIDYQGPNFGGGLHRELSKGHDLLRMVETIWNIKNGRFEGIHYEYGVASKVISSVTQNGNPYEQMSLIEAILNYFQHMTGDFFSTYSLPFPGYSFLRECSNRDLRVLSANMYKSGFNLKNIAIQALSTIAIELIIGIYIAIRETKKLLEEGKSFNLFEDYSNWKNIKEVASAASHAKYQEMFLLAHGITTAINIGKVVVKKAPWEINVTEMMMTVRYLVPVLKDYLWRQSNQAKLARNNEKIFGQWNTLMEGLNSRTLELPIPYRTLEIG